MTMRCKEVTSSRIFLIGPRGSGKTTVARLLAARLGWQAVDADEALEAAAGCTVRAVFEVEGEAGFRRREAALLEHLSQRPNCVVSTGGGVVTRPDNRERLRTTGWVVWLHADAETLWRRMQADATTAERRPPLTSGGLDEIVETLRVREPLYRECAHWTVRTDEVTPEAVADAILQRMKEEG
jgi:shikimate kinase